MLLLFDSDLIKSACACMCVRESALVKILPWGTTKPSLHVQPITLQKCTHQHTLQTSLYGSSLNHSTGGGCWCKKFHFTGRMKNGTHNCFDSIIDTLQTNGPWQEKLQCARTPPPPSHTHLFSHLSYYFTLTCAEIIFKTGGCHCVSLEACRLCHYKTLL